MFLLDFLCFQRFSLLVFLFHDVEAEYSHIAIIYPRSQKMNYHRKVKLYVIRLLQIPANLLHSLPFLRPSYHLLYHPVVLLLSQAYNPCLVQRFQRHHIMQVFPHKHHKWVLLTTVRCCHIYPKSPL